MDGQDHKTTATSTGHEGHGVHLCHRCGWPFPNPHPSAKHRRAHKRVCGSIEGYKIVHSGEHDHCLAVSDDEHASDEDELPPSPNILKKDTQSSGRVGEQSNKSEDAFSDAVTDFSDSGMSSQSEERLESVREADKSMEQKLVESSEPVKVNETSVLNPGECTDISEESNDPRKSEKMTSPEPEVNGRIPIADSRAITVSGHNQMKSGQDADVQVHEVSSTSVTLDSEEGQILDGSIKKSAVKRLEEMSDVSASEALGHDQPSQTETCKNLDTSKGVNSVARHTERSTSNETVEVLLVDESHENVDACVGVKEVSCSTVESHETTLPQETLEVTKQSDMVALEDSHVEQEVKPKTSLAGGENSDSFDGKGEKRDLHVNENQNLEYKESFSVNFVPAPDSAGNTGAPENGQTTRAFEKDIDHCKEKSDSKLLETENERGEGASKEEKVTPDSTLTSDTTTYYPNSCVADSDERNVEELPKNESDGIGPELNHDTGYVSDKSSLPTAPSKDTVSPVFSEQPHVNLTENEVGVQSLDIAESVSELKDGHEVIELEKTSEQAIPKNSASLSTDSELLTINSANASISIDTAKVTAKLDNEDNAVSLRKKSETSSVEESHSCEDVSISESVGIVSSSEHDGNVLASDKCSVAPISKEPVPSPSDLHGTSATGDDKTVTDVEDVKVTNSNYLQAESDDKLRKENDCVSETNLSGSLSSIGDSMEGNCGSVVSDTLETNSQKHKASTVGAQPDKSDTFEPPSFMTLVQSSKVDHADAATEIETMQINQQAGWFPSLTNVVNESEGRKKNEEKIAKVTNWGPAKQRQVPPKSHLNEVKSPDMKKINAETKGDGGATAASPAAKCQDTNKAMEDWNSPARYPIESKKEKKKKGRSYWVPFACCSSVH